MIHACQQSFRFVTVFVMICLCWLALPAPAYADIHLTVVVRDCDSKEPIAGATVTVVTAAGSPSKQTNPSGQATFSKIRPGNVSHSVTVTHPQYPGSGGSAYMQADSSAGLNICLRKRPEPVPVPAPAQPTQIPEAPPAPAPVIEVPLVPKKSPTPTEKLYSISGKIMDRYQKPIRGVMVSDGAGHRASTNANGEYTIKNLKPGSYTLTPQDANHDLWPLQLVAVIHNMNLHGRNFNEMWCGTNQVPLALQGEPSTLEKEGLKNPDWANQPYASGVATIGEWGCTMVSHVMMINTLGAQASPPVQVDPVEFNDWLKVHSGYSGDGVLPEIAQGYFRDRSAGVGLLLDELVTCDSQGIQSVRDDSALTEHLCSGGMAVIGVKGASHWVLAHGLTYENGKLTYVISDPARGQTTLAQEGYNNQYCGEDRYSLFNTVVLATRNSSIGISLMSPVHAVIIDPLGRRAGFDPRLGVMLNEIPGSSYGRTLKPIQGDQPDPVKRLTILNPVEGKYTLEVIGYENGLYHAEVLQVNKEGAAELSEFSGNASVGSIEVIEIQFGSTLTAAPPTEKPLPTAVPESSPQETVVPQPALSRFGFLMGAGSMFLVGLACMAVYAMINSRR